MRNWTVCIGKIKPDYMSFCFVPFGWEYWVPYHLRMFLTSREARYPSLLDWCIYIMIAHQKGCHTVSKNSKKYFSTIFRRDIGRKFVIHLDCISFGIQIPSARHHSCGTIPFFQTCWRRTVNFLRTRGQFLYITCTISHSCPGHYLRRPYGRNLGLPSALSRYHQTLPLDLVVLVHLLEEVFGYRLNHLSMSFSSDSRVPPLVHQACHSLIPRKVFLRKHKDLRRMISEPDTFSFNVFFDFQLWRSPKSFSEYHLEYSEVPTSHEFF